MSPSDGSAITLRPHAAADLVYDPDRGLVGALWTAWPAPSSPTAAGRRWRRAAARAPPRPRAAGRPDQPFRKVPRSIHEGVRDLAREIAGTEAYATSRRERKKVEMLFAHLKRILGPPHAPPFQRHPP